MGNQSERILVVGTHAFDEAAFNRTVGRVLARMRGSDDFDLTRTAQHTGIDRSFLYAIERGEKGVSLFTLFRIASASKLSASQIVHLLEEQLAAAVEEKA